MIAVGDRFSPIVRQHWDFKSNLPRVKQSKRRNAQKEGYEIVEIEGINKVKKVLKKVLTKRGESGRIMKLSQRTADIQPLEVEKFFKEISKNLLTKGEGCDIITRLPQKSGDGYDDLKVRDSQKNFWKNFKKPIDKPKRLWYNNQALAKSECKIEAWQLNNKR